MDPRPIAMFDSGIGGLTVAQAVRRALPGEDLIYLGDTARVPYGTKSGEMVRRYAHNVVDQLLEYDFKALVIACNTATSHALDEVRRRLAPQGIPVLGVIEPGVQQARRLAGDRPVTVLATESTLGSGAYQSLLKSLGVKTIRGIVCPLFVALAEEGWGATEVAVQVAQANLSSLRRQDGGVVVLGCTHYPLLQNAIAEALVRLEVDVAAVLDSAAPVAEALVELLGEGRNSGPGSLKVLVSDAADRVTRVGRAFLGEALTDVQWVDLTGQSR